MLVGTKLLLPTHKLLTYDEKHKFRCYIKNTKITSYVVDIFATQDSIFPRIQISAKKFLPKSKHHHRAAQSDFACLAICAC
jgi:hypothetical protein